MIPWWIKVALLLVGAFQPWLGLPLIFLDGIFHTFTPETELRERSPDWIIARNAWGGQGLGEWVHRAMGIFLLLSSTWAFWKLFLRGETTLGVRVVMPMVLIIIALAIAMRAYYESGNGAAFL